MIPTRFRYLALCAVLLACRDEPPKMATLNEAFSNLPLPPSPSMVSRAGGPDAMQISVRSPATAKQVTDYYRGLFHRGDWRLVNEAKDADGAVVFLAQQHGRPLWVRIHDEADKGTLVELSGAVVAADTTTQAGGSTRSSNRSVADEK